MQSKMTNDSGLTLAQKGFLFFFTPQWFVVVVLVFLLLIVPAIQNLEIYHTRGLIFGSAAIIVTGIYLLLGWVSQDVRMLIKNVTDASMNIYLTTCFCYVGLLLWQGKPLNTDGFLNSAMLYSLRFPFLLTGLIVCASIKTAASIYDVRPIDFLSILTCQKKSPSE